MSYTVGWDSKSNCGWIPWKKLSRYFADVQWLETCFSAVICKFCFVCYCRSSRKTFDTSETQKEIGPIIVQFGKVSFKLVYTCTSTYTLCLRLLCTGSFLLWILKMQILQNLYLQIVFFLRSNLKWAWNMTLGTRKSSASLVVSLETKWWTSTLLFPRYM